MLLKFSNSFNFIINNNNLFFILFVYCLNLRENEKELELNSFLFLSFAIKRPKEDEYLFKNVIKNIFYISKARTFFIPNP